MTKIRKNKIRVCILVAIVFLVLCPLELKAAKKLNVNPVDTASTVITGKTKKKAIVKVKIGKKTYKKRADKTGEFIISIPNQKKGTRIKVRVYLKSRKKVYASTVMEVEERGAADGSDPTPEIDMGNLKARVTSAIFGYVFQVEIINNVNKVMYVSRTNNSAEDSRPGYLTVFDEYKNTIFVREVYAVQGFNLNSFAATIWELAPGKTTQVPFRVLSPARMNSAYTYVITFTVTCNGHYYQVTCDSKNADNTVIKFLK